MFMQLLDRFSWLPATANNIDLCRRAGEGIPRLPLVPLNGGGVWGLGGSAVFLAVCWITTTRIFPYHYAELMEIRSPATNFLPEHNLLLAALWALTLSPPSGEKKESSMTRPEAS
ncbi:MAG: hypothetical protein AVDCRST_MAG14-1628 [uncultured Rubrobacteraceae bacterium]|uniref:Uncharacterized protein n=1 Tax=uncultured Rubrobacteraceae bacterium TaxID=349277 RepID=A0A6J4R3A2_9ACTN|nr:MAG: hypothetical protein AVDCRST_MAG14-1628 [uncultured Rubrobacteraceae bacterium]